MKRNTQIQILKAAVLLIVLFQLASCAKFVRTDNKRPSYHHYRRGGRAW